MTGTQYQEKRQDRPHMTGTQYQEKRQKRSARAAGLGAAPVARGLALPIARICVLDGRRRLLGGFQLASGIQRLKACVAMTLPARRAVCSCLHGPTTTVITAGVFMSGF